MRRPVTIAAAVMITATAVAGCATDGEATRAPINLDTGPYPSKQSKALPAATSDVDWAKLRGIRLSEHLIFPRQVDEALVEVAFPLQPLADARNAGGVFGNGDVSDLPVMKQFQYGYTVTAGAEDTAELSLSHAVLVFDSPEAAKRASDDIAELLLHDESEYVTDLRSDPIAGTPAGTRTVQSTMTAADGKSALGLTPVGAMLVFSSATSDEQARAEKTVATALTKQKSMLESMPAISDDRNPDPHGLIRGTLVGEGGGDPLEDSVYGPRGAALQFSDPAAAYAAMQKAGVTAVAMNGSRAYRTGGDDRAKPLADFLLRNDAPDDPAVKNAASPRDLPTARCWSLALEFRQQHGCVVVVGRYVGSVLGSDLAEAQQKISAQSVFLSKL